MTERGVAAPAEKVRRRLRVAKLGKSYPVPVSLPISLPVSLRKPRVGEDAKRLRALAPRARLSLACE